MNSEEAKVASLPAGLSWQAFGTAYKAKNGKSSREELSSAWGTYKEVHGVETKRESTVRKAAATKPKTVAVSRKAKKPSPLRKGASPPRRVAADILSPARVKASVRKIVPKKKAVAKGKGNKPSVAEEEQQEDEEPSTVESEDLRPGKGAVPHLIGLRRSKKLDLGAQPLLVTPLRWGDLVGAEEGYTVLVVSLGNAKGKKPEKRIVGAVPAYVDALDSYGRRSRKGLFGAAAYKVSGGTLRVYLLVRKGTKPETLKDAVGALTSSREGLGGPLGGYPAAEKGEETESDDNTEVDKVEASSGESLNPILAYLRVSAPPGRGKDVGPLVSSLETQAGYGDVMSHSYDAFQARKATKAGKGLPIYSLVIDLPPLARDDLVTAVRDLVARLDLPEGGERPTLSFSVLWARIRGRQLLLYITPRSAKADPGKILAELRSFFLGEEASMAPAEPAPKEKSSKKGKARLPLTDAEMGHADKRLVGVIKARPAAREAEEAKKPAAVKKTEYGTLRRSKKLWKKSGRWKKLAGSAANLYVLDGILLASTVKKGSISAPLAHEAELSPTETEQIEDALDALDKHGREDDPPYGVVSYTIKGSRIKIYLQIRSERSFEVARSASAYLSANGGVLSTDPALGRRLYWSPAVEE
jgi:hypothetical protein